MALSSPLRVDEELMTAAKATGAVMSRSAAQQINHWARIGRELEASTAVSHRAVVAVLTGQESYDAVSAQEQAVIRAAWEEALDEAGGGIDLASGFATAGTAWTELDQAGNVVERTPPTHRP